MPAGWHCIFGHGEGVRDSLNLINLFNPDFPRNMSDVLLKKVDRKLYSRLKAEAAARGKTVGEVFNEAVRVWLMAQRSRDIEKERNLEAYLDIKEEILEHPGEYFVIAKGSFLGRFRTLHDAFKQMRENKTTKGFVIRSQPSGEWLGGSIES